MALYLPRQSLRERRAEARRSPNFVPQYAHEDGREAFPRAKALLGTAQMHEGVTDWGTSCRTGGLKGPSNLGSIEACAYYLVACSTAYRKKGCRCARCRAWKSAEHQRERYGKGATGQTPQHRQPVQYPVEAVRAEPDGIVEGVPTAPLRPTMRLACGHLVTLPWWEAYPGRAATCTEHGPTLVKSLTNPNKRDVRASPGASAEVGDASFHVHYSPLSWR